MKYRQRLGYRRFWYAGATVVVLLLVAAIVGVVVHHSHRAPHASPTVANGSAVAVPPLEPGRTNCVASPHDCGYPDATNTGVPANQQLKKVPDEVTSGSGWHWDKRGWVEVDGNGATFSGYQVNANIDVTADNVTIADNEITIEGDGWGISLRHTANVQVLHNTISSPVASGPKRLGEGLYDVYADSTGTVVAANNIFHASTGVQMDQGVIRDNYIHDFGFNSGDHLNGTTSNSGGGLLQIVHNTILNSFQQTDAISLFEDFGAQHDSRIENNLLAGGGYAIYGGANSGGKPTQNIRIVDNRISTIYFPHGGFYGPITAFDADGTGNVFSGNIWDATGQPIPLSP